MLGLQVCTLPGTSLSTGKEVDHLTYSALLPACPQLTQELIDLRSLWLWGSSGIVLMLGVNPWSCWVSRPYVLLLCKAEAIVVTAATFTEGLRRAHYI